MIASSFQYDWKNVPNAIKNILLKNRVNDVDCDIYTMEYISQQSTHCSKGNLKSVHQCINLSLTEMNCVIFQTNCSSIKERFEKLGDGMQRKLGRNKHKFP